MRDKGLDASNLPELIIDYYFLEYRIHLITGVENSLHQIDQLRDI